MTDTQAFDFITHPAFRESLEADMREIQRCMKAGAHKSVQVLAGSIVEALLIDYLVDTNDPPRAGKDPLRLDLGEAVALCHKEDIISERAADLSSVIRGYRNLIHPGRLVRLDEPQPDAESATIAVNLVALIVREMAKARANQFGLSADQLLSKIVRDDDCLVILPHLLEETKASEKERLLLRLIPDAYIKAVFSGDEMDGPNLLVARLPKAFRITLRTLDDPAKGRVAAEFARVVREEDGDYVRAYGSAFFTAGDMRHLPPAKMKMVKAHLLALPRVRMQQSHLDVLGGISQFLEPKEVATWIDPIVKTLVDSHASQEEKRRVRDYFDWSIIFSMPEAIKAQVEDRLKALMKRFRLTNRGDAIATIEGLLAELAEESPAATPPA